VFRLVIFKSYVSALVAALHWKVTWPAVFTSWQGALLAGAVRADLPGASITGGGGGVGVSSPPPEEQDEKMAINKPEKSAIRGFMDFICWKGKG